MRYQGIYDRFLYKSQSWGKKIINAVPLERTRKKIKRNILAIKSTKLWPLLCKKNKKTYNNWYEGDVNCHTIVKLYENFIQNNKPIVFIVPSKNKNVFIVDMNTYS